MALRDIFAKMGLCESSEHRNARPRLVAQLIHLARPYSIDASAGNKEHLSTYEERLRSMLIEASYNDLSHMISHNIMPVLDGRLTKTKMGFWSSEIYATFYQQGGQRMLGLYDGGNLESSFWTRGNLDHIEKVFLKVSQMDFNKYHKDDVYLGKVYTSNKVTAFRWERPEDMSYELSRNEWMLKPPVTFRAVPQSPAAKPSDTPRPSS